MNYSTTKMDTSNQKLNCLCRTCLNDVETTSCGIRTRRQQQWLSIFDRIEEFGALQIAELLSQAVPQMEMELSVELPKKICGKCLQQLLSAYRFQQMCAHSEERMRKMFSKRRIDLEMETIAPAMVCNLGTNDTDSLVLEISDSSSNRHTLENTSIPQTLHEVSEHVIKAEAAQTSAAEHLQSIDKSLEDCNVAQDELNAFIKNEPIEDDEPNIDDDSTISVLKDEVLPIKSEEQQVNVTSPQQRPECENSSSTSRHEKVHEANELQACDICGKTNLRNLKRHKLIHTDEKPHKCKFCNKGLKSSEALRQHIRRHTGEKPFKCKYCGWRCAGGSNLTRHLRNHLGINVYRCDLCPLAFPTALELRSHFNTHENEDEETREWNMKALSEDEARIMRLNSKKKTQQPTEQELLQKMEIKATEIAQKHRRKYGKDRPYECPYCPLRFRKAAELTAHKTIHEGIEQEECNICGKVMSRGSCLKYHKMLHAGEKPHKCDFCEMRFIRKQNLQVHMRTHTGEKPYKCKYCKHSFTAGGSLMKHLQRHLGDNVYRCDLCPLAFPSASELRTHFIKHKNEDAETRERNMKALIEEEAKLELKLSEDKTQ